MIIMILLGLILVVLLCLLLFVGYVTLAFMRTNDFPRKRQYCTSIATKLHGKTVVITGPTSGIGFETARDLAKRGAKLIIACRNIEKGNGVKKRLTEETSNKDIIVMECELSDLSSVQRFCKQFLATESKLHILINNAGVGFNPKPTAQNYDSEVGTNYVGHFLLTYLLLDRVKQSAPSRIINVSSVRHHQAVPLDLTEVDDKGMKFPLLKGYDTSKLLNIMHARELSVRLKGKGVSSHSLHPGCIATKIFDPLRKMIPLFSTFINWVSISEIAGAQTTLFCALDEKTGDASGKYYDNCRETTPSKQALDNELCSRLWEATLKLVGDYTKLD